MYNRRTFQKQSNSTNSIFEYSTLKTFDPELYDYIMLESNRQIENLELIASENHASRTVLEVASTVLTDKYAEGYPGRRYYGGCEHVDKVETLACNRAKRLFNAEHANVQPHSGSNANLAVYMAVLNPGDSILGMDLAHGGHLTHGSKVNYSGKLYNIISYGVSKEDERINYSEVQKLAQKHTPRLIIAGASSYPRIIDFAQLRKIADSVNAYLMVDMAHIAGLVAANCHPSPIPHAHFVTTTTHKTLRGPRGGLILIGNNGENDLGIETKGSRKKSWGEVIDSAVMPGLQGGPLMHIIAAKATAFREALEPSFYEYQNQIVKNSAVLASFFTDAGIKLVSGGTDNHLVILNLSNLGISGREAETMLDKANITVNRNVIPFDTRSPLETSGIRIGTAAVTSRGMTENDMRHIGDFILAVLQSKGNESSIARVAEAVRDLTSKFPRRN